MSLERRSVSITSIASCMCGNRRIYERMVCDQVTTCRPASIMGMNERRWAATIRDISRSGVRLHLERRFEKGTPLALDLPAVGEQETSVVFVKVVHMKIQDDGTWMLGCQFVSELSDAELQGVLSPGPVPAAANATPREELAALMPPEEKILSNVHFRINIHGGCQISCLFNRFNASRCWPMRPGKSICISGHGRHNEKWSIKVKLEECIDGANFWKIQARLLHRPIGVDLLRALGAAQE